MFLISNVTTVERLHHPAPYKNVLVSDVFIAVQHFAASCVNQSVPSSKSVQGDSRGGVRKAGAAALR